MRKKSLGLKFGYLKYNVKLLMILFGFLDYIVIL